MYFGKTTLRTFEFSREFRGFMPINHDFHGTFLPDSLENFKRLCDHTRRKQSMKRDFEASKVMKMMLFFGC